MDEPDFGLEICQDLRAAERSHIKSQWPDVSLCLSDNKKLSVPPVNGLRRSLEGERMKGERRSSSSRSRYPDLTENICQVAAGQRGNSLKLAGAPDGRSETP